MKRQAKRIEYYLAGLVAAAAFLVYLHALKNGFVYWDDQVYVYENLHIHSLNAAFLKWAFSSFYASNWFPLTWMSHALDYAIWGLNPAGHHLTNIILHSINTFFVVVLTIRLIEVWEKTACLNPLTLRFAPPSPIGRGAGVRADDNSVREDGNSFLAGRGKLIAGAITGLLFGLHPLHVESVAWVSERKDILCALFYLLSILAYIRYVKGVYEHRNRYSPYLLSLCFFALALMSKPMAVTLPVVLLILDWHPLGRIFLFSFKSSRTALIEKLPFFVLSGFSSLLTIMAQKKGGTVMPLTRLPFSERLLVPARSLALYLWKMFLPLNLVPYYPYPKDVTLLSARFFLPVILIAAVTAFCLVKAKKQKLWLACWGYYVITLLPVIGIVQVGEQAMADRYAYLPSLGPFLAAGVAAAWAWKKADFSKQRRALKVAGASAALLIVISMSYLTFGQIGVWKNSLVFWNYVIKKEPGKISIAYENRAVALEDMGQTGRAIPDYIEAISIDPSFFEAHFNLARAFTETGRLELAIAEYKKVVSLDPSYAKTYNDMGVVSARMGRLEPALRDFSKAIVLDPENTEFYINRGKVYSMSGSTKLAALDFQKACGMGDQMGCQELRQTGVHI
ncbi:MAG: tetratricopeptide repeat protein [Nitrospiraceae bacterium]|nr:tetratricopeptide repeat protein [Nitrospiraceae bacterium]